MLSESQLAWLRANIPAFRVAEEAVKKMREDVEKNRKEMAS